MFNTLDNQEKKFCVCGSCGRTMEKQFVFCPWCGGSRVNSAASEKLDMDMVFNRLEELQADDRRARILEMGNRLDELEKELDTLVLCAEMHK